MKTFDMSGPCRPGEHYLLDPLARLPKARELVEQGKYFVVHSPRRTGTTTVLQALARELNASGRYAAVYASCETAEPIGADVVAAERLILRSLRHHADRSGLLPECAPPQWQDDVPGFGLVSNLSAWVKESPRPLVLLLDQVDALQGQSLVSVLLQLRDGYSTGRECFPHSVVLSGMRDLSSHRVTTDDGSIWSGKAPFNISAATLSLADFTFAEVAELYGQHTEATGQAFTDYAVQRAFEASQGQPWLVNALACELIERMRVPVDRSITDSLMDQAVENLILRGVCHLDALEDVLQEPSVVRIIDPMIAGSDLPALESTYAEDLSYLRSLGLIARTGPVQIANPIYQEVVVRTLTRRFEEWMATKLPFLKPPAR